MNNKKPDISIIIPVYNVEKYLKRCVESVKNQTFTNIEILLIDDGSTDSSGTLCDLLAETDNRIKVIHKQNGGLSSARNVGLQNSNSAFIGFVDSDDWIIEDMYEYLFSLQKKYNADIVSCGYQLAYSYPDQIKNKKIKESVFSREDALENYLKLGLYSKENDYSATVKLYRKTLFDSFIFPNGLLFEDMVTNFALIQRSNVYVLSSRKCYFYFQNSSSITRNYYSERHNDLIKVSHQIMEMASSEKESIKKLGCLQVANSYLSLLAKILFYGQSDGITDEYIEKELLKPFKSHYLQLMKSRIPIKKKFAATIFFINWKFIKNVYNKKQLKISKE